MYWISALQGQLVNLARAHSIKAMCTGTVVQAGTREDRWELVAYFGSDAEETFPVPLVSGTKEQCLEFRQVLFSRLKAAQESPESC